MALPIRDIVDAVQSHAAASGLFDRPVGGHEPQSPPGNGLSAAVWTEDIQPLPRASGLNSTTGLLVLFVRLYTGVLQEPLDDIDPNLVDAVDTLLTAYIGDFTLGGLVRNVDIFGADGPPLRAQAGYLETGGDVYRVYTITLPLIVNDLWPQTA